MNQITLAEQHDTSDQPVTADQPTTGAISTVGVGAAQGTGGGAAGGNSGVDAFGQDPSAAFAPQYSDPSLQVLAEVEQRVLWLSTAIIHHANRVRVNASGIKVGGHQASSASIATIMTSLWFGQLRAEDRVSVKPHASPILHGINYLLGSLDEKYLTTLREFGGLQSYPSRAKDPDPVDYSTGSVGIGATAPIWGAVSRRYAGKVSGKPSMGRQYSLVGDAELDEGAVWEAVLDSGTSELGEIVWIVDLNRQSLDRVVPNIAAGKIERMFDAAGWQVITVRFGHLLESIMNRPGGDALRRRIVDMSNPEYQRLLRCTAEQVRDRLPGAGDDAATITALIQTIDDDTLLRAIRNLGGHDLESLREAYAQIDDTRPTVIIAYTVKGNRLPTEGHPQNHSSLLTLEQFNTLGAQLGENPDAPFSKFASDSAAGRLCAETAARLEREPYPIVEPPAVPADFGRTPSGTATTQAALGRALLDLTRAAPAAAAAVVTVSPDVSSSTNLAGWLNKVGVWSVNERQDWFSDDAETIMHWREKPTGQHIELGIAEVNLVSLLGELGATWSRWSQPLFPIGVLYDPFVERALEPWSYGIYAGGQSILVGTPSGVTLAPEGGAHQSIKTPSIGLEQPGCISYEPAFALDTEWVLLASLGRLGRPDGTSAYLRLSTKPLDQQLASIPEDPAARERRRRQVIAGGYVLRAAEHPDATIVTMGVMVPEALEAADRLLAQGTRAEVICVTSPGLLYEALQGRNGQDDHAETWILDQILPAAKAAPMVTVLDGHPHTLAFLGGINRVPMRNLGVSHFGQAGDVTDVYRYHSIDVDSIIRATLDVIA
ncbi:transketolase-like TK C-terminal-containing protein [Subtercola lobariae]|uniref:Pyruvate dehydrogenase E1 component n=1 Tax=Subtercola lobariae TaxID=1588641 RepID=A0A917EVQ8_9MICO|nr:transketolase C-terminal domain-containing protein [Subtercola lobariae]GGF21368.1 pyruvate dehydrogenase E1 component [Subtercola lobariae]